MDFFLNLSASGIVIGSLYGLLAMAFAVIYRTTGVVNFAQGEVSMLITYIAYSIGSVIDFSLVPLVVLTIAAAALVGLVLERLFIRPMLGESVFSIVMITVGLAIMLRSLTIVKGLVFPPKVRAYMDNLAEKGDCPLYDAIAI